VCLLASFDPNKTGSVAEFQPLFREADALGHYAYWTGKQCTVPTVDEYKQSSDSTLQLAMRLPLRDVEPHITRGSFGPHEYDCQMASCRVHPFLHN